MVEKINIETSIANMLIKDGILRITLKDGADLEVDSIDEMIAARKSIQKDNKMLVLADIRRIWQASKEAREKAASKEMTDLNLAMAILTESLTSLMLANFFIKINKPATPTKMFRSEEKALQWLNLYR